MAKSAPGSCWELSWPETLPAPAQICPLSSEGPTRRLPHRDSPSPPRMGSSRSASVGYHMDQDRPLPALLRGMLLALLKEVHPLVFLEAPTSGFGGENPGVGGLGDLSETPHLHRGN